MIITVKDLIKWGLSIIVFCLILVTINWDQVRADNSRKIEEPQNSRMNHHVRAFGNFLFSAFGGH